MAHYDVLLEYSRVVVEFYQVFKVRLRPSSQASLKFNQIRYFSEKFVAFHIVEFHIVEITTPQNLKILLFS